MFSIFKASSRAPIWLRGGHKHSGLAKNRDLLVAFERLTAAVPFGPISNHRHAADRDGIAIAGTQYYSPTEPLRARNRFPPESSC